MGRDSKARKGTVSLDGYARAFIREFHREAQQEGPSRTLWQSLQCGSCRECCRAGYDITLTEQEAASGLFPVEPYAWKDGTTGVRIAKNSEKDPCQMLGPNGCTVYENRPKTCREYDCRPRSLTGFADLARKELTMAAHQQAGKTILLKSERDHLRKSAIMMAMKDLTMRFEEATLAIIGIDNLARVALFASEQWMQHAAEILAVMRAAHTANPEEVNQFLDAGQHWINELSTEINDRMTNFH